MNSRSGVISAQLRDAARASALHYRVSLPPPLQVPFMGNKATDWLQTELLSLLDVQTVWSLSRYDLPASSSIDSAAQQRVTDVLTRLRDPAYDQSLGLVGKLTLTSGNNPAFINWSFVLYARGAGANYVGIHADSLNEPFDINSGAKLQLGSTAKLRTMITYFDIMTALHSELAPLPAATLQHIGVTAPDTLTRWAARYFVTASDRGLKLMLDAAMQRTYSASPVTFFTGGGNNGFDNFEHWEDSLVPTVAYAFQNSINCVFVQLIRDTRDYYVTQSGVNETHLLSNPHDPARAAYLRRAGDNAAPLREAFIFFTASICGCLTKAVSGNVGHGLERLLWPCARIFAGQSSLGDTLT
jgi:membrane peptidoglycan carboxypeptidase